ncbi:Protein FAR1-RELATED SEQUENCE 11 [Bienertia sinuspersici]
MEYKAIKQTTHLPIKQFVHVSSSTQIVRKLNVGRQSNVILLPSGGHTPLKVVDVSNLKEQRIDKMCCNAHMRITLKRSFDIFPEEWHVTKFSKEHNHEMLPPEAMRFLPANRSISQEDEKQILLFKEAGLSVRQICEFWSLKKILRMVNYHLLRRMFEIYLVDQETAPKTIITDQDPWMSKAIESEMATTKHSYCIWHITSKFSCWFATL